MINPELKLYIFNQTIDQFKKGQIIPLHDSKTFVLVGTGIISEYTPHWKTEWKLNHSQLFEQANNNPELTPYTSYIRQKREEYENGIKEQIETELKAQTRIKEGNLIIETITNKPQKFNVNDYAINTEKFRQHQPFFYDVAQLYWIWNKQEHKWTITDETDLLNELDKYCQFSGETISSGTKNNYLESFKRIGRQHQPKPAPTKWIQFKDKAYSLSSNTTYDVTPDYFFTNPIPWELGSSSDTPELDKVITEWVGKKNLTTMHEIIAYCCYADYPISLIFCFVGSGRNGKSKFLQFLNKFLGVSNVSSTELDTLLTSRFESFKLYKKLACILGETNFGVLQKTSLLKKLTGGDLIGYELKNKKPFDDVNYAKIIISSNSLPTSDDTSEGFYRRWLIVDFPNEFVEGCDVLTRIPQQEYENLARKVTEILPKLLQERTFTNQGSIEDRRKRYVSSSNPLPIFVDAYCEKAENHYVSYNELYQGYVRFLHQNKKRKVNRKEFKTSLENEGYYAERLNRQNKDGEFQLIYWVEGLRLRSDFYVSDLSPTRNNDDSNDCNDSILLLSGILNNKVESTEYSKIKSFESFSSSNPNLGGYLPLTDDNLVQVMEMFEKPISSEELADIHFWDMDIVLSILQKLEVSGEVIKVSPGRWLLLK